MKYSSLFLSVLPFVGACAELTNKICFTQPSFRTPTCGLTSRKRTGHKVHFGLVSQTYSYTIAWPLSSEIEVPIQSFCLWLIFALLAYFVFFLTGLYLPLSMVPTLVHYLWPCSVLNIVEIRVGSFFLALFAAVRHYWRGLISSGIGSSGALVWEISTTSSSSLVLLFTLEISFWNLGNSSSRIQLRNLARTVSVSSSRSTCTIFNSSVDKLREVHRICTASLNEKCEGSGGDLWRTPL